MRELFQNSTQYLLGDFGSVGVKANYPKSCWDALELLQEGRSSYLASDFQRAIMNSKQGLKAIQDESEGYAIVIALWEIKADAHASLNCQKLAIRCGQRLLKACERLKDNKRIGLAHLALGHYHFDARVLSRSLAHYQSALTYLQTDASDSIIHEVLVSIADCHANLGHLNLALQTIQDVITSIGNTTSLEDLRLSLRLLERKAFYLAWAGNYESATLLANDVCGAFEDHAQSKPDWESDLARSLDHLAEILETASRLEDALAAAEKSTALRFARIVIHKESLIPYLRSLVTLARLHGALGNSIQAVGLCEEAEQLINDTAKTATPIDLLGQIYACHGRHLMQIGQYLKGEKRLLAATAIFRRLGNRDGITHTYRIAEAQTLVELGKMHLISEPSTSRRYLARAIAWKERALAEDRNMLLSAEYAESLILLCKAEIGAGDYMRGQMQLDKAIQCLADLEVPPGGFHEIALETSQILMLIASQHGDSQMAERFAKLARPLCQFADLADEAFRKQLHPKIKAFFRMWLEYFLGTKNPQGIIQLMTFSHGRKLAEIADRGFLQHPVSTDQAPDNLKLLHLRKQLQRHDLEFSRILHPQPRSNASPLDGRIRSESRLKLFRAYIELRDKLIAENRLPDSSSPLVAQQNFLPQPGNCIAMCGIPSAFGSQRAAFILVMKPDGSQWLIVEPRIDKAHQAMSKLMSTRGFGRSGFHGAPLPIAVEVNRSPSTSEAELDDDMQQIWTTLTEVVDSNVQLHLITQSDAHNLPWLSTAPAGITLRQYPSLHDYCRGIKSTSLACPSLSRPIHLLMESENSDPLSTLYYPPLEKAILHAVWPSAVIEAHAEAPSSQSEISAVWIIGHGHTIGGHPLLGRGKEGFHLADCDIFRKQERRIDLIYASTCYLGQTRDVESEPVGLFGLLSALRPSVPTTIAATTPIGDLSAVVLALLFNTIWQEQAGSPAQIFKKTQDALRSGNWPENASRIFDACCTDVLPGILEKATSHAQIDRVTVQRHYGKLLPSTLLAYQHAIRRKGQDLLQFWQVVSASQNTPSQILAAQMKKNGLAGRYWSCIG